MSVENKELVRRWFEEVWNQRREETIDELLAADAVLGGLGGAPIRGPAEFKQFHRAFLAAFSDVRIEVEDLLAEGDRVATRCRGEVTLPDGRTCTIEGGGIATIRDGQLAGGWNVWDFLGLLEQMQSVPGNALFTALSETAAARGGGQPGA